MAESKTSELYKRQRAANAKAKKNNAPKRTGSVGFGGPKLKGPVATDAYNEAVGDLSDPNFSNSIVSGIKSLGNSLVRGSQKGARGEGSSTLTSDATRGFGLTRQNDRVAETISNNTISGSPKVYAPTGNNNSPGSKTPEGPWPFQELHGDSGLSQRAKAATDDGYKSGITVNGKEWNPRDPNRADLGKKGRGSLQVVSGLGPSELEMAQTSSDFNKLYQSQVDRATRNRAEVAIPRMPKRRTVDWDGTAGTRSASDYRNAARQDAMDWRQVKSARLERNSQRLLQANVNNNIQRSDEAQMVSDTASADRMAMQTSVGNGSKVIDVNGNVIATNDYTDTTAPKVAYTDDVTSLFGRTDTDAQGEPRTKVDQELLGRFTQARARLGVNTQEKTRVFAAIYTEAMKSGKVQEIDLLNVLSDRGKYQEYFEKKYNYSAPKL
ncbi:MAG: hypothetical protein KAH23_01665 [Kiritimatiellae bacterium]|nr:hypothetical protein [Kiritimatiellia bacterium]